MNETLDQHGAHRPLPPPTGWRHAAHSGGKAVSSTMPKAARLNCARRAMPGRRWVSEEVSDMPAG
jgi:hypothetical protein